MDRSRTPLLAAGAVALSAVLAACGRADDVLDAAVDDAEATASSVVEEGAEEAAISAEEVTAGARSSAEQLQAVVGDQEFATLFQTLEAVGFDDIAEAERFTFFAQNDGAFAAIDADFPAELLADPGALGGVLRDHLLDDIVTAADLIDGATVTTTGGLELIFDLSGDQPTVNGIPIVRTDVAVEDRGVVHVIDGLLMDG